MPVALRLRSFFLVITNGSLIIYATDIEYIFILAVLALVPFFLTHQEIKLYAIMAEIIVPLLWNMR